jgi:hypothetical protein
VSEGHDFLHEVHERRGFEIPFADLQIVDACIDGLTRLFQEASPDCARVR